MGRWWPLLWCWFSLISKLQKCLPKFPYFLNFCTSFRSFKSFGVSLFRMKSWYQNLDFYVTLFYSLDNVVYKHSLLDLERCKNEYYVRIFLWHQYQANILLLCQSVEFPYPCKNNCLKFYDKPVCENYGI